MLSITSQEVIFFTYLYSELICPEASLPHHSLERANQFKKKEHVTFIYPSSDREVSSCQLNIPLDERSSLKCDELEVIKNPNLIGRCAYAPTRF